MKHRLAVIQFVSVGKKIGYDRMVFLNNPGFSPRIASDRACKPRCWG